MAIFFSKKSAWNLSDTNSGFVGCGGRVGFPNSKNGGTLSAAGYDASSGWADDIDFSQNDTLTDLFFQFVSSDPLDIIDRTTLLYLMENIGTVTMTIANPCVVTYVSHGLVDGDAVGFTTTGALPTNIAAFTPRASSSVNLYYAKVITPDTFHLYFNKAAAISGDTTYRKISTGTQSGTHTLWVSRRDTSLTSAQIMNHATYGNTQGTFFYNWTLSSPIAVTTGTNKYRFAYGVSATLGGTSTSGWQMGTYSTATPANSTAWAGCGSTVATPVSGTDFLIIRDTMTIDMDWTMKGHMYTGTTIASSSAWCLNKSDWSKGNGTMIKWQNVPAASYTFTIDGAILCSLGTNIEIGTTAQPIPISKPAKIYLTSLLGSTLYSGFKCSDFTYSRGPSLILNGEVPTYETTTLASTAYANSTPSYPGGNKITVTASWAANNELFWVGAATSVPTGLTIGTLYMLKNKSGNNYDVYDKTGVTQITFTGSGVGSQYIARAINVVDAVDWDIGDGFSVGGETVSTPGQGDSYLYTIGDITADKKFFSGSPATGRQTYYNSSGNLTGAPVINVSRRGVKLYALNSTGADLSLIAPGLHCQIKGLANSLFNHPTYVASARLFKFYPDPLDVNFTTQITVENSVFASGTSIGLANTTIIPQKGIKFQNNYFVASYSLWLVTPNTYTRNGKLLSSGLIEYYDAIHLHNCIFNYGNSGAGLSIPWKVERVTVHNQGFQMMRSGVGSTWTDMTVYESAGTPVAGEYAGVFIYKSSINSVATNDKIDRILTGVPYYAAGIGSVIVNNRIVNPLLDTVYTPTGPTHFAFGDSQYSTAFTIENTNVNPIISNTNEELIIEGSVVTFLNWNSVANDDRNYYKYGQMVRTGTGLGDTTARTGGFAMRFSPASSTNSLRYSKTIPTGNIQNKDMMVGVWCKINSANYWAGTNQMPRLEVNYDNGTIVYAEAAQIAGDWQFLPVPFKPTTTAGQITVTLDTRTDATSSDAYVYFDDFSTLFPAGTTLSLGNFDLWSGGEPIAPYISTSVSAQDVWAAQSSQNNGTGTMGKQVNDIKKDTGLIPALL